MSDEKRKRFRVRARVRVLLEIDLDAVWTSIGGTPVEDIHAVAELACKNRVQSLLASDSDGVRMAPGWGGPILELVILREDNE